MPSLPSIPTSLFPAVFRAIPFEATAIDRDHGVEVVTHEFPNTDAPYNEPMRRKTRRWTFRGCVTGETGPLLRDLLIAACEVKLPGILWHQNIGLVNVYCVSCRPHEAAEEGQFTTWFDLQFVEAGAYLPAGSLVTAALAAKLAVMGAVSGIRYAAADDGSAARQAATAAALKSAADVIADRDVAESLLSALDAISAQSGVLASDTAATVTAWQSLFVDLENGSDARAIVHATADIYDADPSELTRMIHLSALQQAATQTLIEEFRTWEDAAAMRDDISTIFESALQAIDDLDLYAAVVEARGQFVIAMNAIALQLPRLKTHRQESAIPALVLAHRLYGDASRVTDIISRNGIGDPTQIAGSLRVLAE